MHTGQSDLGPTPRDCYWLWTKSAGVIHAGLRPALSPEHNAHPKAGAVRSGTSNLNLVKKMDHEFSVLSGHAYPSPGIHCRAFTTTLLPQALVALCVGGVLEGLCVYVLAFESFKLLDFESNDLFQHPLLTVLQSYCDCDLTT